MSKLKSGIVLSEGEELILEMEAELWASSSNIIARVIGAIGLLKNKMWGLALSIINCILTMALMMFMLPAGIMDGILATSALILILVQYFGNKKIIE